MHSGLESLYFGLKKLPTEKSLSLSVTRWGTMPSKNPGENPDIYYMYIITEQFSKVTLN